MFLIKSFLYPVLKKKLLIAIEDNFKRYGFSALSTSPMELSSVIGNSLSEDESNPMSDVFTFDEDANKLSLHVNNALYREFDCKDNLNASIKFHEALDKMISCFNTWRIYERN